MAAVPAVNMGTGIILGKMTPESILVLICYFVSKFHSKILKTKAKVDTSSLLKLGKLHKRNLLCPAAKKLTLQKLLFKTNIQKCVNE